MNPIIALYRISFIEQNRPVNDPNRMQQMRDNATFIISAWDQEKLVGICRCLSDFSYVTYISDLVVHPDYQKQGIGKQLIAKTQKKSGPQCKIVLLANTQAKDYYPHIGFSPHKRAWVHPKPT